MSREGLEKSVPFVHMISVQWIVNPWIWWIIESTVPNSCWVFISLLSRLSHSLRSWRLPCMNILKVGLHWRLWSHNVSSTLPKTMIVSLCTNTPKPCVPKKRVIQTRCPVNVSRCTVVLVVTLFPMTSSPNIEDYSNGTLNTQWHNTPSWTTIPNEHKHPKQENPQSKHDVRTSTTLQSTHWTQRDSSESRHWQEQDPH